MVKMFSYVFINEMKLCLIVIKDVLYLFRLYVCYMCLLIYLLYISVEYMPDNNH